MKTNNMKKFRGQKFWMWTYVFSALVLSFQNCGPSFSSNGTVIALDSIQGSSVITASNSNNYSPNKNLSFSFDKTLIGNGPLVWSNLLNSTTTCTEVSANNVDPYIVNCTGKGILTITLVVNSGTSGIVGPLSASYVVNDGLPRSTSLVPFVISNATGDWNKMGVPPPPIVPLFLRASNNQYIIQMKKVVATVLGQPAVIGQYQFTFNNNNRFLNGATANWSFSSSGCTGVPVGNNLNVSCVAPVMPSPAPSPPPALATTANINITLAISGSDPQGGTFVIPSANWTGVYTFASDSLVATFAGLADPPGPAPSDPLSANYIGAQELLQTNVLFVGQTLRIFNKASATKQFGINFNGAPCASTGPIPFSDVGDYSQFVDCVITSEFGDPAVGSPVTNAYDSSQKFYLVAIDGVKLYNNNCKMCHLDLSISRHQIGNETLARLRQALLGQAQSQPMLLFDNSYASHLSNLTDPQKLAIIHALQN